MDVQTDKKRSYRGILGATGGSRLAGHQVASSKALRKPGSLLFPINHTLAMLRDGVSRLVRRTWAASKRRACLADHLWVWVAYRNYIRPVTVQPRVPTPAQCLGVTGHRWTAAELLRWKVACLAAWSPR